MDSSPTRIENRLATSVDKTKTVTSTNYRKHARPLGEGGFRRRVLKMIWPFLSWKPNYYLLRVTGRGPVADICCQSWVKATHNSKLQVIFIHGPWFRSCLLCRRIGHDLGKLQWFRNSVSEIRMKTYDLHPLPMFLAVVAKYRDTYIQNVSICEYLSRQPVLFVYPFHSSLSFTIANAALYSVFQMEEEVLYFGPLRK